MKLVVFINSLGLGGTEKAACRWARGLQSRGHAVSVLTLADGPRREELESFDIHVRTVGAQPVDVAEALRELGPEVIHAHAPGYPHAGDVLGEALRLLPQKIPVVQTNIFGLRKNPREEAWTDFRLFISWTSCVQFARRTCQRLEGPFFLRNSVVTYPLDPLEPATPTAVAAFRNQIGVADNEILFGRLSRPEPNKWTDLAVAAFRRALRRSPNIKLLLREPPPLVAAQLRAAPDAGRFVILPVTADAEELHLTMSALDVVLHTSSMGESFGYGIAEPMNLGKPVITHSLPWRDQAQLELARHEECGFIAGTPKVLAEAIAKLANDRQMRQTMGRQAQQHIRRLADPEVSLHRLETLLRAARTQQPNPLAAGDLARARDTAKYLDAHQFGHSWREQLALRPFYYRVRFHEFRKRPRS
jgi:glycosyltransferase involved in cell wall biosynthesis